LAASSQETSSKTIPSPAGSLIRKPSRARFGFGGRASAAAAGAYASPTPAASVRTLRSARAWCISAPLTWSGVSAGRSASTSAAIPETIGAESEVPERVMYGPPGVLSSWPGRSAASVESEGTGPTIARPGAESSGFEKPSSV